MPKSTSSRTSGRSTGLSARHGAHTVSHAIANTSAAAEDTHDIARATAPSAEPRGGSVRHHRLERALQRQAHVRDVVNALPRILVKAAPDEGRARVRAWLAAAPNLVHPA